MWYARLTRWLALGFSPVFLGAAMAQSPPAKIDLETIAKVCSGATSETAPNARGKFTDSNGYTFEFGGNSNEPITVSRGGVLLYKIEKFTATDYVNCLKEMVATLTTPPLPEQRACQIPQNGIARYKTETNIPMTSPERSGGGSQPEWCNTAISLLRAQNPTGEFTAANSSESQRSACPPANCPLYTYYCTIHVKSDPEYIYKKSPFCPP
jgi:hypothetical protein